MLLVLCAGNSPVTGEIRLTNASDTELWYFLWSAHEQTVERHSRSRWLNMPSRSLGRHSNVHHVSNIFITQKHIRPLLMSYKTCYILKSVFWFGGMMFFVALMASSHHPNQCWDMVNWTLGNKLQWNLIIFIQENISECRLENGAYLVSASICFFLKQVRCFTHYYIIF